MKDVTNCKIPAKDFTPNIFVLTDIRNEPDDAQSLIRLLLYSNELSLRGIIASTSYWLKDTTHADDILSIIDTYGKVHANLLKHSESYLSAEFLSGIVSSGHPVYGLEALKLEISDGAKKLIRAVDDIPVHEKLYVLAESLKYVSVQRDEQELSIFISKIRVYAISDQDDSGPWIRAKYPDLFYIASIHGFNQYAASTWIGIPGEILRPFDLGGPDSSLLSKKWIQENIQNGPLGKGYPETKFIMKGDTPTTLDILPNGLNSPENPNFGSWGGRYTFFDISGNSNL